MIWCGPSRDCNFPWFDAGTPENVIFPDLMRAPQRFQPLVTLWNIHIISPEKSEYNPQLRRREEAVLLQTCSMYCYSVQPLAPLAPPPPSTHQPARLFPGYLASPGPSQQFYMSSVGPLPSNFFLAQRARAGILLVLSPLFSMVSTREGERARNNLVLRGPIVPIVPKTTHLEHKPLTPGGQGQTTPPVWICAIFGFIFVFKRSTHQSLKVD